jgi:catechol 2,3-dioxygenase-like lactoylglutathione lyase family enzyme
LAAAARRPGGGNIPEGGGGRWWDFATGRGEPLPADAYAVRFAPAGTRLAVARFRTLDWFDHPADPDPAWRLPHTVGYVADVAFAPAGDRFVAAAGAHLLIGEYGQPPARVKTGLRAVLSLAVSPDGGTLLAGGVPGGLEVHDLPAGTRRAAFDFGLKAVHAVAVAPDGLTATAGGDGGLVRFDLDAG